MLLSFIALTLRLCTIEWLRISGLKLFRAPFKVGALLLRPLAEIMEKGRVRQQMLCSHVNKMSQVLPIFSPTYG